MVKAILFDFWGTLVENGVWSPIKQVKNILKIELPFSEYVVRMERAMMTQNFPELRQAFESVAQEFNLQPDQKTMEDLIGLWNKSWMLAQPYQETISTLEKLRQNYQLILISNTDCFSLPQVLKKFQFNHLFDYQFLSFNVGAIKTDKIFLKTVLAKLNLQPEDCILVGDSIQSDIIPAKRAGLNTILIDRKNNRDFHPKIKNLADLEKSI